MSRNGDRHSHGRISWTAKRQIALDLRVAERVEPLEAECLNRGSRLRFSKARNQLKNCALTDERKTIPARHGVIRILAVLKKKVCPRRLSYISSPRGQPSVVPAQAQASACRFRCAHPR